MEQEHFRVLVNHEEQYSIWPDGRQIPSGWNDVGVSGPKDTCLEYIGRTWTDMRPLSLRKQLEELRNNPPPAAEPEAAEPPGPTLVERLSTGRHPVVASVRPARDLSQFKACLDRGYVCITFTETQGGTELGVRLNKDEVDLSRADFASGAGQATLAGTLTLDFVDVKCHATIRLPDLSGVGWLVRVEAR